MVCNMQVPSPSQFCSPKRGKKGSALSCMLLFLLFLLLLKMRRRGLVWPSFIITFDIVTILL